MPLSAALHFVLECARRSCGARAYPLAANPDWPRVLQHAEEQSLFVAVAEIVADSNEVAAPHAVQKPLQVRAAIAKMQRRLRQEPGIRRVLATLLDAGCDPIVLKGVALAYTRYARPDYRSFADLDILLPASQLDGAYRELLRAGFQIDDAAVQPVGHQHLPPLFAPQREIVVELHSTLFDSECPFDIDIDAWIARAVPATILDRNVRMLSPADAILHTAAHLSYGHRYLRHPLRSLTDLLALSRYGDVDWEQVASVARSSRMDGAVVWPLALARSWLDAPIPTPVLQKLLPAQPLRRLIGVAASSGYILDRTAISDDGTAVAYDRLLELSLLGQSSIRGRGKMLLGGLFPLSDYVPRQASDVPGTAAQRALHLVHPVRIARGIKAMAKLIAQRGELVEQTDAPGVRLEGPESSHPARLESASIVELREPTGSGG